MASRSLEIYAVEAFTLSDNLMFTGNTAAVCILETDDEISDEVKQGIARDMNLSETAFVTRSWGAGHEVLPTGHWTLRWFTPGYEVPLCGHATLASARVLFTHCAKDLPGLASISFHSRKRGVLTASVDGADRISLDFPSQAPQPIVGLPEFQDQPWLAELIKETLRVPSTVPGGPTTLAPVDVQVVPQAGIVLLRVGSKAELTSIAPNFSAISELKTTGGIDSVVVTAEGEAAGPHFYSRFFAPWCGINEDPVTGLGHTVLTPYWNAHFKHPKPAVFQGVQLSTRGGEISCELTNNKTRVKLSGTSRITLSGKFCLQEGFRKRKGSKLCSH